MRVKTKQNIIYGLGIIIIVAIGITNFIKHNQLTQKSSEEGAVLDINGEVKCDITNFDTITVTPGYKIIATVKCADGYIGDQEFILESGDKWVSSNYYVKYHEQTN